MKSKKFYEKVMKKTTPPGRRTMEKLKKVCDSLEERGLEISIARVHRESERLGWGPSKPTISSNANLREYVKLRLVTRSLIWKLMKRLMLWSGY